MAVHSTGKDVAGAVAPAFVLDRREAIPKLVGRHEDFLIVTGLKGPRANPMRNAMFLAMGTTVVWFMIGVMRGGDSRAASWQVYLMLAYLDARGLAALDPAVLSAIRQRQASFGPWGLRLAFAVLDRYVVDGRRRGVLMGNRRLALIWTALLQRGRSWRKASSVASRLYESAARRWLGDPAS